MKLKKLVLIALAATMAIGVAGCGSQQQSSDSSKQANVSGSITGSGSSALLPLVKDAAEKFKATNKDVTITLNAGGSGTGLKQVSDGSVDMATLTYRPKRNSIKKKPTNWKTTKSLL